MRGLMPVDIVDLVLKIQAINSNMREEFMACKPDSNLIYYRLLALTFHVQFVVKVSLEKGT